MVIKNEMYNYQILMFKQYIILDSDHYHHDHVDCSWKDIKYSKINVFCGGKYVVN